MNDKMTHILIIYESIEPGNIETRRVFKLLEEKGILESRGVMAVHVSPNDLKWCDVVLFVRSTSAIERDLALFAKKMGKFILLSIDDDFLSLGSSYGADGAGYRSCRHKCLKDILKAVDCLITVNELLAQKYIRYCHTDRYVVTNTIVEEKELFPTFQDGNSKDNVNLAIYVNDGTQGLFNQIIRPALRLLTRDYCGRIALYLMALHPDMSEFEKSFDIHFVPHMPYREFKEYMGKEDFDIGLAPLTETGFSKYKYFNKYIEYTLAGIPAIYSDCELYRLVVKDGYNGLLTKNSAEEWSRTIAHMVNDAGLRKTLISNAQKHLYDNFRSDRVLEKLTVDIPEITNYKVDKSSQRFLHLRLLIIHINYSFFRIRGWFGTAFAMIRKGNYILLWKRFRKRILKV